MGSLIVDNLPSEVVYRIMLHTSFGELRRLCQESQYASNIFQCRTFQREWLTSHRAHLAKLTRAKPEYLVKILLLLSELNRHWAFLLYDELSLRTRVEVVSKLLEDRSGWALARHLASIEQERDDEMADPSFGIYYRHLKFRFISFSCPLEIIK